MIFEPLNNLLGVEHTLSGVDTKALAINLPALTLKQFEFYKVNLPDLANQLLVVKVKDPLPTRIIENAYKVIQKDYPGIALFYFDKLLTQDKQKLIREGVQLIIANNFLYAPELGFIGETKSFKQRPGTLIKKLELSPIAETILVGQLLDERFSKKNGREIAEVLKITPAAVSQVLKELEKQGLVYLKRKGAAKITEFEERDILWGRAKRFLKSPVEAEVLVGKVPKGALRAGLTALADNTILAESEEQTFAIYKRLYEHRETLRGVDKPIKLQLWRRDPTILASNGEVDLLSLYLSLENNRDERIEKERATLLEKLDLKVENV